MFKFWWKKEDPRKKLYPSFQARVFAVLVDTAFAALILVPIFSLASSVIYHDLSPTQTLSRIMNKASKRSGNFKSLSQQLNNDPEYKKFIVKHGYESIVIEQAIQIILFGLAIFIFWLKWHTTPGKIFLSMKIVDEKTLKKPSIFQLVVRLFSYVISLLPFGFGIFYIALNKKHRAWHDIISGTVVINKKELAKYLETVKAQ